MVTQRQELSFEITDQATPTEMQSARAMHEIQSALVIAKRFPRDEEQSKQNILNACKRISLAVKAQYSYPRAKTDVRGASIRLAETIARYWGNMNCGVREISRGNGTSMVQSFAIDLETNNWKVLEFEVSHEMQLSDKSMKRLTDPRDIYEHVANMGARRLRACILAIIPPEVEKMALDQCRATCMDENRKKPLADRIRDMVNSFDALGVKVEHLEKRLGHKIDLTIKEEILEMSGIHNSLRDNMSKREDWFEIAPPVNHGKGMSGLKSALGLRDITIERVEIDGQPQRNLSTTE